jgi:hypothetical protein
MRTPVPAMPLDQIAANTPSPVFLNPVEVELGEENLPPVGFARGVGATWESLAFGSLRPQESRIGSLFIRARRLGVILDDSPSMTPFLPELRSEIRKNFRGSVFREVTGCFLGETKGDKPGPQLFYYDPAAVMRAIRELVEDRKVDALFWFCDLQDGETEEALEELREVLGIGRTGKRPVKFYVRSLDQKPSDELMQIIDRSGGEIDVVKP